MILVQAYDPCAKAYTDPGAVYNDPCAKTYNDPCAKAYNDPCAKAKPLMTLGQKPTMTLVYPYIILSSVSPGFNA